MNNASTETMQRAAVYAKAAQLMERTIPSYGGYVTPCGCCEAIGKVIPASLEGADLESPFAAVFKPKDASGYWWGNGECICFSPETKGARILALCFMAAMVEAGDA